MKLFDNIKNEIDFEYLCDFFLDDTISSRKKNTIFFSNKTMIDVASQIYPMIKISWENRHEILYLLKNRMKSPPKCNLDGCDNYPRFRTGTKYRKFCSNSCCRIHSHTIDTVKEKIKQTNLERYGCEIPLMNNDIKEKIKRTNIERYGTKHALSSDKIQNKIKRTNLERYGTEHALSSDKIRDKIKRTNLERYGTEHHNKSHLNNEYIDIFDDSNIEIFKKLLYNHGTYELANLIGCDSSNVYFVAKKHSIQLPPRPRSYQEQQIIDLFQKNRIKFTYNNRSVIPPYELDFYIPDYNIAIELNGVYWHCEKFKDKNYHYNKWKLCQNKGIDLYSVFEDDFSDMWLNKILYLCKVSTYGRLYARKCEIIEIDSTIAKKFLNKNHLQGNKYSSINIGLQYQDELVSLMSFSNTRNNDDGVVELTRFCNKMDTQVVGGASKLLSYFINTHGNDYDEIISFSDNTYSGGRLYKTLGFDLEYELKSDYKYVINNTRVHKTNYRKSKIQQKFNLDSEVVDKHTEKELMDMLGIYRIWDCGKKKWIMKL